MKRIDLKMLECGHCRHSEAMTMKGAPWRVTDFPSLVGFIRHPDEGVILFDTGYDEAFLEATAPFPERLYRWTTPVALERGESAAEQLYALGICPDDVRHVVISHFHGDHVAGLYRFRKARIHCSRAGYDDLRSHGRFGRVRHGLLADLVPERTGDAAFFEDGKRITLPAEFRPFTEAVDVLGDGSLLAVELPGHCPGHWGLALRLEDDRHAMLVGDAAWSIRAIEQDAPPPSLTTRLLGNPARQRRTLSDLHDINRRSPGTVLLPSHCRTASRHAGLLP